MLFSLKDLASRLSPTAGESLHVVKTNTFTLHHFQSITGFMFVLNTKAEVPGLIFSLCIEDFISFCLISYILISQICIQLCNTFIPIFSLSMSQRIHSIASMVKIRLIIRYLPRNWKNICSVCQCCDDSKFADKH